MSDSPALTLLLQSALTASTQRLALMNAFAHPLLPEFDNVCLVQTFKPAINGLRDLGLNVSPLQGEFDTVLLLPSKDKVQSLAWMASAFHHVKDGGKVIVACENQYGAKSYESALKRLAGHVNATSKSKCRLFSARKKTTLNTALQKTWLEDGLPKRMASHGLWAQAGLFSWKKTDVGSQLLLEHLPELEGDGLDLCCGYGLLSAEVVKKSSNIKHIHLVEAEALALACARKNLAGFTHTTFYHMDATTEVLPKYLDWIICNPPFHTGQSRDVTLGQTIVERACESLKYNGELYLVANRQLPYEKILKTQLREVECLVVGQGFKVIRGKK